MQHVVLGTIHTNSIPFTSKTQASPNLLIKICICSHLPANLKRGKKSTQSFTKKFTKHIVQYRDNVLCFAYIKSIKEKRKMPCPRVNIGQKFSMLVVFHGKGEREGGCFFYLHRNICFWVVSQGYEILFTGAISTNTSTAFSTVAGVPFQKLREASILDKIC